MSLSRILLCMVLSGAASLTFGQTSATVNGTLTVDGKATKLSNALALQTKDWTLGANHKMVEVDVIKLVLSDSPVDDVEDDFELGARGKAGTLNAVRLVLGKKGEVMSGNIYHKAFEGGTSGLFTSHIIFESKAMNNKTVAGKVRMDKPMEMGGPKHDFNVTFSSPVQVEPKPTTEGTGASETAPAKAVQKFLDAVQGNDAAGLKAVLRKEFVEMLESPDDKESVMAMLNQFFPAEEVKQLKIVRVFNFGNRAWVEGATKRPSQSGGSPTDVTYRIRTVRVGSDWKVQPM